MLTRFNTWLQAGGEFRKVYGRRGSWTGRWEYIRNKDKLIEFLCGVLFVVLTVLGVLAPSIHWHYFGD